MGDDMQEDVLTLQEQLQNHLENLGKECSQRDLKGRS